jgi:KipI family sensor histidine kinase inhibitor
MRLRQAGPRALLVELEDLGQVQALHAVLIERRATGEVPAVVDIVPAARTVLLDGVDDLDAMASAVAACPLTPVARPDAGPEVEIPVIYDGEDLPWLAERWGTSVAGAVALHSGITLRAAFCGFSPGFAYLAGLPERCHVPRRSRPRPEVPAGAVGVAGEFTGVYPRPSPGGWHLIGRTEAVMWDPSRPEPALVVPGASVRFVAVGP